jgi:hypothetical protein
LSSSEEVVGVDFLFRGDGFVFEIFSKTCSSSMGASAFCCDMASGEKTCEYEAEIELERILNSMARRRG